MHLWVDRRDTGIRTIESRDRKRQERLIIEPAFQSFIRTPIYKNSNLQDTKQLNIERSKPRNLVLQESIAKLTKFRACITKGQEDTYHINPQQIKEMYQYLSANKNQIAESAEHLFIKDSDPTFIRGRNSKPSKELSTSLKRIIRIKENLNGLMAAAAYYKDKEISEVMEFIPVSADNLINWLSSALPLRQSQQIAG